MGGQPLVSALDLDVREGDLIEIRGPNGSGKSTLLRCLAGLFRADAGGVERRAAVEYIGHKPGLCADMTPLENLRWLASVREGRLDGAALTAAMDGVGLAQARHDRCGMLSAGQLRRAALARLLVGDTAIWLLDEPLTALDDAGVALTRGLLNSHRANGGAAVCATHRALALPEAALARTGASVRTDASAVRLPQTRVLALGG